MHAVQLSEKLAAQSLFSDCKPDELADIILRGQHRSFKRGQEIMAQGDEGDALFIVLTGLARVSMVAANGREIILDYAEPGAVLGEIAFLDGGERTASVHAVDPVEALSLTRGAFDEIVATVVAAERGGLDLIGIQDHPYQRRYLDTFALIADLLARTSRLRFFPDVASLPMRGPTMIAP